MRAIPSIIRIINRQVLFRGSAYATTVSFGVMVYDCITLSKQNAVTSHSSVGSPYLILSSRQYTHDLPQRMLFHQIASTSREASRQSTVDTHCSSPRSLPRFAPLLSRSHILFSSFYPASRPRTYQGKSASIQRRSHSGFPRRYWRSSYVTFSSSRRSYISCVAGTTPIYSTSQTRSDGAQFTSIIPGQVEPECHSSLDVLARGKPLPLLLVPVLKRLAEIKTSIKYANYKATDYIYT